MPECHFKVAELKMHLRSLVLGAVSRRVGWEVALGERMEEGVLGVAVAGGLVSSRQRIRGDCLKLALAKHLAWRRHGRTRASGSGAGFCPCW